MSKRKQQGFVSFISVLLLMIVIIGCSSNGQSSQTNPSAEEGFDQLLTRVYQSGEFVFEGLPWLISRQEVIDLQQLADTDSDDDRLIIEGDFPLDTSVEQTVIYRIQDDQLVSGEYLFITTDRDHFIDLGRQLQSLLSDGLPEPFTNNLDVMNQADQSADQGQSIGWEGTDGSYLRVNLLTAEQQQYVLQIQSSSPLPERESLE